MSGRAERVPIAGWAPARTFSLVERNFMIYRRSFTPLLSSMVEPVLYLLSIGLGVGHDGRRRARCARALRGLRRAGDSRHDGD